jgi:hypothetical protein
VRGSSFVCTEHPYYLTGSLARDVSRLTDIPPDDDGLFIDLSRLSWADKWKAAWAMIGAHAYIDLTEARERDWVAGPTIPVRSTHTYPERRSLPY